MEKKNILSFFMIAILLLSCNYEEESAPPPAGTPITIGDITVSGSDTVETRIPSGQFFRRGDIITMESGPKDHSTGTLLSTFIYDDNLSMWMCTDTPIYFEDVYDVEKNEITHSFSLMFGSSEAIADQSTAWAHHRAEYLFTDVTDVSTRPGTRGKITCNRMPRLNTKLSINLIADEGWGTACMADYLESCRVTIPNHLHGQGNIPFIPHQTANTDGSVTFAIIADPAHIPNQGNSELLVITTPNGKTHTLKLNNNLWYDENNPIGKSYIVTAKYSLRGEFTPGEISIIPWIPATEQPTELPGDPY